MPPVPRPSSANRNRSVMWLRGPLDVVRRRSGAGETKNVVGCSCFTCQVVRSDALRVGTQVLGGTGEDDPPAAQHAAAVRDRECLPDVLLDQDHRDAGVRGAAY